jgi:hypothetical protein
MNNSKEGLPIPPARPEIIAEIVAVDCLLADLFLKCQDNAREVDELVGVLDNHLSSCENVRDILLNLPVEKEAKELTMTNLSMFEQRMIVSTGLFSKMLLDVVRVLSKSEPTALREALIKQVNVDMSTFSDAQVTQILQEYSRKQEELTTERNKRVSFPTVNN